MVDGLCRARAARDDYPELLFVHKDTVERGREFFAGRADGIPWIADRDSALFDGFGIARARWGQMLGWTNVKLSLRALGKGFGVGRPGVDVTRMPGLFLVRSGDVLWEHDFDAVGDHPDFAAIGT